MTYKIFNTPLISKFIELLFRFILKVSGWTIVGERPLGLKKFVVIGAPHTSNWDILIVLMTSFALKLDVHWLGKHKLFRWPFYSLMSWLGGIPVNRDISENMVNKAVQMFAQSDTLVIGLAPEGTRSKTNSWRSGFWYIAHQAQVPIVLAFVDAKNKQGGILGVFQPTDDVDADIATLQSRYEVFRGINEK